MKLVKASYKAVKYACIKFHYAKSIPVNTHGYSVFNDENEWCGVILFGSGANNNICNEYGLRQGEVIELVRVALNGKQKKTSRCLGVAMRLLRKDLPLCKLLVSYADKDQDHLGVIYQATNWYYTYDTMTNKHDSSWIIKGERVHGRRISDMIKSKGGLKGLTRKEFITSKIDSKATPFVTKGKIKYIYPVDKSVVPLCKMLSKPYPKK